MKRIVLTASVFSAMILSASAQQSPSMVRTTGKTTFGVHAGVNMFNINGKDVAGNDLNNKVKTGFEAGVNAEIPLGSGAYLQPGVDFRQKGAEFQDGSKATLNYIDVPVNFIYKPILGTGNFVLGVGPYVGFGLGGKVKYNGGGETDIEFGDDVSAGSFPLKRIDAGANFQAGYEFANRLGITLKAQLGLKDIDPYESTTSGQDIRFRNTGFGLSLGYRF
ncbi:MAG TPA: porin family protein [Flavisolibacter sp.]|nr:porin family protein [Flavisolibacter sp.]